MSGEILTAIGMTEPSGGSELAALKITAIKDGDDWVLNGSKTLITNGYSADLIVVAARTDPEAKRGHGISLFGVEATMPGFSRAGDPAPAGAVHQQPDRSRPRPVSKPGCGRCAA